MGSRLNGFDVIAPRYDFIKELVFGKAIYKSELCFLEWIPRGGKILIIGGGTGEILSALIETNRDADIFFVEASSEMLRIAEKRLPEASARKLRFIHGTEHDIPHGILFDAVITNFFLDLFPDSTVGDLCQLINSKIKRDGVWLVSDFVNMGNFWQRVLLWTMYRFFRFTSRVVATELPAWERHIAGAGMEEVRSKLFYRGFIKSSVYRSIASRIGGD